MTTAAAPTRPRRRRPLRWLVGLLLLAVAVVAGANIILRVIPLKSIIEEALTKELGMPFVIGEFHPWAFPQAYITAYDVRVGEGDYRYTAESMKVRGSLWKLAWKVIDIEHAEIEGFRAYFPPTVDEAIDRWNAMIDHIETKGLTPEELAAAELEDDGGGWQLIWRHAETEGLSAYLADVKALGGFLAIDDITFDTMYFDVDMRMTALTEKPRVVGQAALVKGPEEAPSVLTGSARVEGFHINDFGMPTSVPPLVAKAEVSLDGPVPENLALGIGGTVTCDTLPGLSAQFTAKAWVQNDRIILNDLDYRGESLHIQGDLTKEEDDTIAFHVTEAEAQGDGLTALMAVLASRDAGIEAQGDGELTVRDFVFGSPPDAGLQLVGGAGRLEGIDFVLPTGEAVFTGLSGDVRVDQGAVLLDNVTGEGVRIAGRIMPNFEGGGVHVDLAGELSLHPARFAPWMDISVLPRLSGSLAVEQFAGTFGGDMGLPQDFSARAQLQEVSASYVAMAEQPPLEFDGVGGTITYTEGVFTLDQVQGQRFLVSGTLRPLYPGYAVDVSGSARLDAGFIRMLMPEGVSGLGGEVTFDQVAGTFTPEEPLPADLVVKGRIAGATAKLALDAYSDAFRETAARFDSSEDRVQVNVERVVSEKLGTLSGTVDYAVAGHGVKAVVNVDLNQLASFIESASQREALGPVLAALGPSELTIEATLPHDGAAWSASIVREGAPALEARLGFAGGGMPEAIDITATLPASALAGYLPESVKTSGAIDVRIAKTRGDPALQVDADLTPATLTMGDYISKPAGGPAGVSVGGRMEAGVPTFSHADVTTYGESVRIVIDDTPRIESLELALEPLSPLLAKGGSATGRMTGSVGFTPPRANLALADASITLQPGARLEGINGQIAYDDGLFKTRDLRVYGADSVCTFDIDYMPGQWEAELRGEKLNLDALLALIDAGRSALTGEPMASVAEPLSEDAPLEPLVVKQVPVDPDAARGNATIDLATVFYKRGRLDQVRAQVEVTGEAFTVTEFTATPYTGQVSGTVRVGRTTDPPWVDTRLRLAEAEMRIVDEMLFLEPRNAHGIGNGTVETGFYFTRFEHLMKSMQGKLELDLRAGSYGSLGAATRALAFLRALEVMRLRVPQLKDKGLTFDTSILRMYANEGAIALEQFDLASTAYEVTGEGIIDYQEETLDIQFRMHLLELLTGVVSRVPILGDAVDAVTAVTDLVITGSGSPFDPKFVVTPGLGTGNKQQREERRQQVRDAVEGVLDTIGM